MATVTKKTDPEAIAEFRTASRNFAQNPGAGNWRALKRAMRALQLCAYDGVNYASAIHSEQREIHRGEFSEVA